MGLADRAPDWIRTSGEDGIIAGYTSDLPTGVPSGICAGMVVALAQDGDGCLNVLIGMSLQLVGSDGELPLPLVSLTEGQARALRISLDEMFDAMEEEG
jgi:hypothetical protein